MIFFFLVSIVLLSGCSKKENDELLHLIPITETKIDNEVFSLEVPESFIGKVAYCVDKKKYENNAYLITFHHLASVTQYFSQTRIYDSGEEVLEQLYDGTMGYIFWHDEPYYVHDNESDPFDWDEDLKASPVSYDIAAMNKDNSGAYVLALASDVQFSNCTSDEYIEFESQLPEIIDTFILKVDFPNNNE